MSADHTHELVVINPATGRAKRWASYASREAADVVRLQLAVIGMYAMTRRLAPRAGCGQEVDNATT